MITIQITNYQIQKTIYPKHNNNIFILNYLHQIPTIHNCHHQNHQTLKKAYKIAINNKLINPLLINKYLNTQKDDIDLFYKRRQKHTLQQKHLKCQLSRYINSKR